MKEWALENKRLKLHIHLSIKLKSRILRSELEVKVDHHALKITHCFFVESSLKTFYCFILKPSSYNYLIFP